MRWLLLCGLVGLSQTASAQLLGFPPGAFDNISARSPPPAGVETITPTNPGTLTASAGYSQTGTYANGPPAALDWSFDGTGCASSASSPTISGGNFSFSSTAPSGAGSHTITVCDHANHAILGTTSSFTVNASGYQGPGDVVGSVVAAYGFQAYAASYATGSNNCCVIYRSSDATTSTIKILSSGIADDAGITTFCGSANANGCSMQKWVNQANPGTGDCTASGVGGQPPLVPNATGAHWAVNFQHGAGAQLLSCAGLAAPLSFLAWAYPTSMTGGQKYSLVGGGAGDFVVRYDTVTGSTASIELLAQQQLSIGTSSGTIANNAWSMVGATYVATTGAYAIYINGSASGSGTNAHTIGGGGAILGYNSGGDWDPDYLWMEVWYNSALTPTQMSNLFSGPNWVP